MQLKLHMHFIVDFFMAVPSFFVHISMWHICNVMAAKHCKMREQGSKRKYRMAKLSVYARRERDRTEDQRRRTAVMEETERKGQ